MSDGSKVKKDALLIASEVIPIIQKSLEGHPSGLQKANSALYAAYPEVVAEYLEHDPQHRFPGPEESHKGEDHSFRYRTEDGGKTAPQFDQSNYQPNIEAEPDMDTDSAKKAIGTLAKAFGFDGSTLQKKKPEIAAYEERAGLETSPSKVGRKERSMLSQAGVNPKTMRHVGRRTIRSEKPKDQAVGAKAAREVFGDKSGSAEKPKPKSDKFSRYKSLPAISKYMASDAGKFKDPARDNLRPMGDPVDPKPKSDEQKSMSSIGSYGNPGSGVVKDYKADGAVGAMCPTCKKPYAECAC